MIHTLLQFTWPLGIGLEIVILALVVYRRGFRAWPSLLAYCLTDLLADALLQRAHGNYALRFYTYWGWHLLSSITRLWILFDVLRSLPGAEFLHRELRYFMFAVGAVLATLCFGLGIRTQKDLTQGILSGIGRYELGIAIVWCAFLVAFLIGIRLYKLTWSTRGALVTNGLGFKAVAAILVSFVVSYFPANALSTDLLQTFAALLCLTLWLSAFALSDRTRDLSSENRRALTSLVAKLPAR